LNNFILCSKKLKVKKEREINLGKKFLKKLVFYMEEVASLEMLKKFLGKKMLMED